MDRRVVLRLGFAGLAAGALSGCGADGSGGASRVGDGIVEQFAASDRQLLGVVTGTLLSGEPFSSESVEGQVVVYNVWGSWCAPCRTEAPILRRVHEETRDDDVAFVGVNVRDNDSSARAFERRFGIEYPSINTETSADALRVFGNAVPPNAVPSTLVLDREGRLAARVVGPVTYSTLSTLVEEELGSEPSPGESGGVGG